jgi:hypothetical protein
MFCRLKFLYSEELLAFQPPSKLEDEPLMAVLDYATFTFGLTPGDHYSGTSVHELNLFLETVRKPKLS